MVSDKLLQNTKPSDDMVEYEMCSGLTVEFNHGHSLSPFCKIVNSHYNMMMPPIKNKCIFMLVLGFDLDLIVSRKAIHKGKYLTSRTLIQNLINKWCGKIILRTGTLQVMEISAYTDRSLLLINWNGV